MCMCFAKYVDKTAVLQRNFQQFLSMQAWLLIMHEYTSTFQAFAWFSDLLVEHSEIFWSLFGVDMDTVLAEQPPDTWDLKGLLRM